MDHSAAVGTWFFISLLVLYFVPALCALGRGCRGATAIVFLNIILGWTLIGWLIAFIWANAAAKD